MCAHARNVHVRSSLIHSLISCLDCPSSLIERGGDAPINMTLLELANEGSPTELGPPPPPPSLPNVTEYYLGTAGQTCTQVRAPRLSRRSHHRIILSILSHFRSVPGLSKRTIFFSASVEYTQTALDKVFVDLFPSR